jgi:hypothetical protein
MGLTKKTQKNFVVCRMGGASLGLFILYAISFVVATEN